MRSLTSPKALGLSLFALASLLSSFTSAASADHAHNITVRGYVACLDANARRLAPDSDCNKGAEFYQLMTAENRRYGFVPGDALVTMFTESRVRKMELQVKGVLHDQGRIELTRVQARRDGKLYDIFYYCEVCEITAYGPGPCFCCYGPFEFRERLATDEGE